MSKRKEWDALGEDGQYKMCIGCIGGVANAKGFRVDPLAHVGGVWERVALQVDGSDLDLTLLVWQCAGAELQQVKRHEEKAAACADFPVYSGDGDALGSILDLIAGTGSVENEAVTRIDFAAFYDTLDAVNKRIVGQVGLGMTLREISRLIGISTTAIDYRIHRMRKRLSVCMGVAE